MRYQRLKYLVSINRSVLPESTDANYQFRYIDIGSVGRGCLIETPQDVTFETAPSRARRVVRPGDTIISTVRTYLRAVWPVSGDTDDLIVSTGFAVLTPGSELHPRFLGWLAQSDVVVDEVVARSSGISYPAISSLDLGDIAVPIPAFDVQRQIATFLDSETAHIDSLIDKKAQLNERLAIRPSLLAEALLVSEAPVWPHWPLKFLVRERDERLGGREPLDLLSVSIYRGVVPREELTDDLPRAEELSNYKICRRGDIVLNRMRAFQGGVGMAAQDGIVSPDYTVIELGPRLSGAFAHHLMRTPWFVGEMIRRLRGIGGTDQGNVRTPRIGFADLGMIPVPLPPLEDQIAIAARLDASVASCRATSNALGTQISLLDEHRQALVGAAVRGSLTLDGVAA